MAGSNILSDKAIRAALKAAVDAGMARKISDGEGLHLEARPTGAGWWRLRYRFGGKEVMLSLGTYPEVGLALARQRRADARELIAAGTDPSAGLPRWRDADRPGRCHEAQQGGQGQRAGPHRPAGIAGG